MQKATLIKQLNLQAHIEGGYFARTYQSTKQIDSRALMSSIYYMLTDDSPIGHFHMNQSDIMHYFHLGSPIKYWLISPTGELESFILGPDVASGHVLQKMVHGGYWKASELQLGEFGLLSEAVTPGFDYADMKIATLDEMAALYPQLIETCKPFIKKY